MLGELFEHNADSSILSASIDHIDDQARAASHDLTFVKQFLIEFEFLCCVTAQELDRLREQMLPSALEAQNMGSQDLVADIKLAQKKCN